MPELPEVEHLKRSLTRDGLIGARVTAVEVGWERTVGDKQLFRNAIMNAAFTRIGRRAKYLVFELDNGVELVAHMRMSGRLSFVDAGEQRSGYERVVVATDIAKELRFHDPRKFGRLLVVEDVAAALKELAPEPLGEQFNAQYLRRYLRRVNRRLKPLLLDQKAVVAGLGNIYVDEALWESFLHPLAVSSTLTAKQSNALYRAVVKVIRKGIENCGTSLGDGQTNFRLPDTDANNSEQLQVFQRNGQPCYRCGKTIERIVVGGRSSHICPNCQKPV